VWMGEWPDRHIFDSGCTLVDRCSNLYHHFSKELSDPSGILLLLCKASVQSFCAKFL
jgi:hypothetical protein